MSAEKPPLIFEKSFGSLRPSNQAAKDAMSAIEGTVVVKMTRMRRNQARRAFYWAMLSVAANALSDRTGVHMDAELLADVLKQKLGLGETITLPSGDTVFKPRSTSDRAMDEQTRAAWTDRCAKLLASWLQVEIHILLDEARAGTSFT